MNRILYLLIIEFTFLSCTTAQVITPFFQCSDSLDNPYGTVTFFSTPGMDASTQRGQLELMNEIGISNIRTDIVEKFWRDGVNLERRILNDTTQKINFQYGKNVVGVLSVGEKKHRPWDCKEPYLSYVKNYVSRYKDNITYWEIMNEINWIRDISLYLDCKNYCDILPSVYQVVKEKNPNSIVLLSGLAGVGDECMKYLCEEKAYDYFDIFNFHTYAIPEEIPIAFKTLQNYMRRYKWSKPVWITECGMSTPHNKESEHDNYDSLMIEQARRVGRIFLISFAYGVDKVFWYNFRSWEIDPYDEESHFGVLHSDLQPKPAFLAYQTLTKMCPTRSERPKLSILGDCYICSWVKPDKKKVFALWCVNRSQRLKIRVEGHPEYYNLYGERIKKPINLTDETIYILGAKSVTIE